MSAAPSLAGGSTGTGRSSAPGPRSSFGRGPEREGRVWKLRESALPLDRPLVMGILNLTPDSFSDGGELATLDSALERAEAMVAAGAALLDIGGESTRPGAREVPEEEELERILPFVRAAAGRIGVPLSVDTRKAEVARAALAAGAAIVNDVSGLTHDPEMPAAVAETGAGVVVMHMRGTPRTMRERTDYDDVVLDVRREIGERVAAAVDAGIEEDRIVVDPGIGFAKTAEQSLTLLRELPALVELGYPVLVGPSRKSFLGAVLGTPADDRLEGTLAACAVAHAGGARIFRVHDVEPAARLLEVLHAVERGSATAGGPAADECATDGWPAADESAADGGAR